MGIGDCEIGGVGTVGIGGVRDWGWGNGGLGIVGIGDCGDSGSGDCGDWGRGGLTVCIDRLRQWTETPGAVSINQADRSGKHVGASFSY